MIEELVNLYHRHHVLIYPTWGEGFGFIPAQALASGMPVITTYPWAEYKEFIGPLKIKV
jgi:glycosyltransferase involved in cell wall biosynthesis